MSKQTTVDLSDPINVPLTSSVYASAAVPSVRHNYLGFFRFSLMDFSIGWMYQPNSFLEVLLPTIAMGKVMITSLISPLHVSFRRQSAEVFLAIFMTYAISASKRSIKLYS